MHWSQPYIGIPFKWGGYSREGASCWGLIWLIQREVFGRNLLKHTQAGERVSGGEVMHPLLWADGVGVSPIPLGEARDGDILHMRGLHRGSVNDLHIGMFTSPREVLHTELGTGSIIERVDGKRAAWRVKQAYRFDQ